MVRLLATFASSQSQTAQLALQKVAHEIGDLIGGGVEREVAGLEGMHLGARHFLAIRLGPGRREPKRARQFAAVLVMW